MQKPPNRHQPNSNNKPPVWELDTPLEIKGVAPEHMNPGPRTSTNNRAGPFGHGVATYYQNQNMVKATAQALEQEYQARTSQIPQSIETELAAIRSPEPLSSSQSITRELAANHQLTQKKTAELHTKNSIANAFFGGDPFNRHINEFMIKATTMERRPGPHGIAMQAWATSYRAAHDAKLLSVTIQTLNQRTAHLHQALAAAQAAEHAQRQAEQEAQRVAAELARINEAAAAQAREQARLAALAEAQRLAREQAWVAAEVAARNIAAEQARLQAQAEAQQQAEQERLERDRTLEPAGPKPTLAHVGSLVASGPAFTGQSGEFGGGPANALALRAALRTAVSVATSAVTAAAGPVLVGFAALLIPSPLGNGDLYSVSVPLAELAPIPVDDLYELASVGGEVSLPLTLGSSTNGNRISIVVATTDGMSVPSNVSVSLAQFDAQKNAYVSGGTTANAPILTWTPLVDPLDQSTDLPLADIDSPVYEGPTVTPSEGRIDPFPQFDHYGFGGHITVFPADSGLPPIFTLLRDRRQDPGVASGAGQMASRKWLGAASTLEGAPIPKQIADKLRGREFSSFRAFRRNFWKAMASDKKLSKQFTHFQKFDMKHGLSPTAPTSEHVGSNKKYEIHHLIPISEEGSVYDMDNLRLVTPKQHIEAHKKLRNSNAHQN